MSFPGLVVRRSLLMKEYGVCAHAEDRSGSADPSAPRPLRRIEFPDTHIQVYTIAYFLKMCKNQRLFRNKYMRELGKKEEKVYCVNQDTAAPISGERGAICVSHQ